MVDAIKLLDRCSRVHTTTPISPFAVASTLDESGPSNQPGRSHGESMESKINALPNMGDVVATSPRLGGDGSDDVSWRVTFKNAPHNFPQLKVVDNNVQFVYWENLLLNQVQYNQNRQTQLISMQRFRLEQT